MPKSRLYHRRHTYLTPPIVTSHLDCSHCYTSIYSYTIFFNFSTNVPFNSTSQQPAGATVSLSPPFQHSPLLSQCDLALQYYRSSRWRWRVCFHLCTGPSKGATLVGSTSACPLKDTVCRKVFVARRRRWMATMSKIFRATGVTSLWTSIWGSSSTNRRLEGLAACPREEEDP